MLISVSRRTDIPAFFGKWFINRVRKGYCLVKNPYNPKQISRVDLKPDQVEAFVFWTRNVRPFIPILKELTKEGYAIIFLVTITGYSQDLEPSTPLFENAIESITILSDLIGPSRVAWRYDPIILSNKTPFSWHIQTFKKISTQLSKKVDHGIISFVDFYRKTLRNLKPLESTGWKFEMFPELIVDFNSFIHDVAQIALNASIPLISCCEKDFSEQGISPGGCLDSRWLNRVLGLNLSGAFDPGQRKLCRCAPSKDIGACDSCLHGCKYCYATRSNELALQRPYNPESEFL